MPVRAETPAQPTLLTIPNHHVDESPTLVPEADDYVAYFESREFRDQWVFVRKAGAEAGTLYGGDLGWEGIEVRSRTPDQIRGDLAVLGVSRLAALAEHLEPLAPSVILAPDERAWLNAAWWASSSEADSAAEIATIAQRIVEEFPDGSFDQHPNSTVFRSAMTALAFTAGQAAGMRGMNHEQALALMQAVMRAAGATGPASGDAAT